MQTKKIILGCIMMISPMLSFAQQTVTIKGHVKFIDDNFKVSVYRYSGTKKTVLAETPVDPATHNYSLSVPFDKAGQAILDCGNWQDVTIWLEDENLDVDFRGVDTAKIKIKNPPYVYIKGGKNNELMNKMNFLAYRNYQGMIAYSQAAYRAKFADEESEKQLTAELYQYGNDNYDAFCRYFVEHYADRNSVLVPIGQLRHETDGQLIEEALQKLERRSALSKQLVADYRNEIKEEKERKERMKVGNPAPNFTFQNAKGKKMQLSDFKGKVLVLDFWASWCGPCRGEIPNMKNIFSDFKDKGIEMLSVSIDAKKDAWTKAMNEEKMPWKQGWVTDGGAGVMDLYQFGGIPFILVIDQAGNLYRKNVRGNDIRKALEDVLAGKPASEKKTVSISMGAMSM